MYLFKGHRYNTIAEVYFAAAILIFARQAY